MKRTLTISILLLFSGGVVSQVPDEVHEKCKDARDYVGCIQVLTGATVSKEEVEIEEIKNLKKALALLPSRLQNTSLRDFSMAIQPFTDALAAAEAAAIGGSDYSLEDKTKILKLTNPSLRLSSAVDIFRSTWRMGIEFDSEAYPSVVGSKYVPCSMYDASIDRFNQIFGSNVIGYNGVGARIIDYSNLSGVGLTSFRTLNTCYMNDEDLRVILYPNTQGRPIYREYEGTMLYWIIEAVNEITATGEFPTFTSPYKSLDEVLAEAYKRFELEEIQPILEDIEKYKKIHEAESNPWNATNDIYLKDRRATKIFKGLSFGLRNFSKSKDINKSIDGLKYLYASDFTNFRERFCKRRNYICHQEKISHLVAHSTALAKNIVSSNYGTKKENILFARELVIAGLSQGFETCEDCFNQKGVATQLIFEVKEGRKHAHKTLKELNEVIRTQTFEDFVGYEGLTLDGHLIHKALD